MLGGFLIIPLTSGAAPSGQSSTTAGASISSTLCSVFDTIKTIIFILALTLMVLGGVLYSGANLTPSQLKGQFQGYGMAMIMGGVIGIIIVLAAPYILSLIINASGGIGSAYSTGTVGNGGTITSASGLVGMC